MIHKKKYSPNSPGQFFKTLFTKNNSKLNVKSPDTGDAFLGFGKHKFYS